MGGQAEINPSSGIERLVEALLSMLSYLVAFWEVDRVLKVCLGEKEILKRLRQSPHIKTA